MEQTVSTPVTSGAQGWFPCRAGSAANMCGTSRMSSWRSSRPRGRPRGTARLRGAPPTTDTLREGHSAMEFEDILYEVDGARATITLNRPEKLNAFRTQTLEELCVAFESAADDERVGVIVFTGAGERAFCVGGDVADPTRTISQKRHVHHVSDRLVAAIRNNGKPDDRQGARLLHRRGQRAQRDVRSDDLGRIGQVRPGRARRSAVRRCGGAASSCRRSSARRRPARSST